jgi:uncharacterized alkaline shock family protein YloU
VKWKVIKQIIHTATEEVLGLHSQKTVNGWFDEICQTALDIRNEARKKVLQRGRRANALE